MKSKGSFIVQTTAVVLNGPRDIRLDTLTVAAPQAKDLVVQIKHSGISTGTEKLFWSGKMPPFPGMGYPLVPGYEATGEVVEAPQSSTFNPGDTVFVPGANCYDGAFGLFGGAARYLVSNEDRVIKLDGAMGAEGAL
jgi:3-hydroxyethyl bacteriochlorophyllide a dehydrogenase